MTSPARRAIGALALLLVLLPAAGRAEECLHLGPTAGRLEVDVRVVIRLTDAGRAALGTTPIAYVEIDQRQTFRRRLAADDRTVFFSFSRPGRYTLRLRGARNYDWPNPETGGAPVDGCDDQIVDVLPLPPLPRPDFQGVRPQWWLAYRPAARGEIGAAVFFGRVGLAVGVEGNGPRFFGDRHAPENLNRWTASSEIRWRGARGYLGAGLRYFPDEVPERDRVRFAIVGGEELPTLKGLPIWLTADLRFDERRAEFWKGLAFSLGVRFDMPGSRP